MKYNNGNGWKCGTCDGALGPDEVGRTCSACLWRLAERKAINEASPFKGATGGKVDLDRATDEPTQEPTQDDVCVGPTRLAQIWFETLCELGVYAA